MNITKITRYLTDQGFELILRPAREDDIKIKKTKKGCEVKYIVQDECAPSPDEWFSPDKSLFLVNYHRDFWVENNNISKDEVRDWFQGKEISQEKDYYFFELSCLIHGGVRLSLNRSFTEDPGGWDTSHIGVILVSKKEAKNRVKAVELAERLIKEWNMYLQGDVYATVIETFNKKKQRIDYDVCGGYYGYEYAMEDLKEM